MYQRFKRGLFLPSELSMYLKDSWLKVWAYFFLMLILSALPFIMVTLASDGLSVQEKHFIKENYTERLAGSHQIIDGQLMIEPAYLTRDKYLKMDVYTFGIVNTPTSPEYQGIRLIFVEDGVRLYTFNVFAEMYTYEALNLENYDFSNSSTTNIDRFIKAVDLIVKAHNGPTKAFQTAVTLGSSMVELMFFVLISAAFSRHLLPFKFKLKMAIYVLTPYVVMSLFALFLNNSIFIFVGIIMMMVYMRKAFSKLTLI